MNNIYRQYGVALVLHLTAQVLHYDSKVLHSQTRVLHCIKVDHKTQDEKGDTRKSISFFRLA